MAIPTIEISSLSLYRNGVIYDFPNDGEQLLVRDRIIFIGDDTDDWHTCIAGDRLELLAYEYYSPFVENAHELWWAIAEANNIYNPFDLTDYVGKDLLIPNYDKIKLVQ